MNILVIGCGKIGSTIISSLVAEGHDVTALDNNPKTILQFFFILLQTYGY